MDNAFTRSEPSVLVYARYFGLTRCHTNTGLLSNFDRLPLPPGRGSLNRSIDQDCARLLQSFEEAASEHLMLANDEPLHISKDVTTVLKKSTSKADLNLHDIYQTLLPDPHYLRKHKLNIPLLLIGGGDVHKDVRRLKKGINLTRVLDDLLEDYEVTSRQCGQDEEYSSSTASAEILEMAQDQLEKATQTQVVEVTAKSLQYLKDVLCSSLSKEHITQMLLESLPQVEDSISTSTKDMAKEDFELDFDEGQDRNFSDRTLAAPNDVEAKPLMVKQEINDLLYGLDVAVDNEIFRSANILQADDEMNSLLKQFTNHDVEELDEQSGFGRGDTRDSVEAEPPQKRRKLIHKQDDRTQSAKSPSLAAGQDRCAPTTSCWQARKVTVPRIELYSNRLPLLELDKVLAPYQSAKGQTANSMDNQQPLPLTVPCMEEVMRGAMPDNAGLLDRYLGQPKPIVTSDKLLFKEPGLRALDKTDKDEEDLVIEDYRLDEWKAHTFVEGDAQVIDEPQTCFFNRHNPTVKVEPNEHQRRSISGASCLEDAEAQPDTTKSEHPSAPSVQQSLSPPQPLSNPFNRSAADIECELNHIGEHVGQMLDPQATRNKAHHTDVKAEHKVKPKETVAQLLNRIRKSQTRLSRSQSEEYNHTPFSSDTLSGFLDLRGKRFKAPPVQQICKESKIAEDPIQSTQSSVTEQVEGAISNPSTKSEESKLLRAEPQVLPSVTALDQPKTIVLNSNILQKRPLLAQFLERTGEEQLILIYRDLDQQEGRGPDIILNPCTCLQITNLQALNQRPLPGQRTATGLSNVHDHVAMLWQRYSVVIIFVHYLEIDDAGLQQKQTSSMALFTSFCQQLTAERKVLASIVLPIWIGCLNPQSTSGAINAWVWQMIQHRAYETPRPLNANLTTNAPAALIQDETLWEILLVKAGLNPLAAQLVIGPLKRSSMPSGTSAGTDSNWGLRRLVSMEHSERHDMFDNLIGRAAVDRLSQALRGG